MTGFDLITFIGGMLSSLGRSKNGFLLFGTGDTGGAETAAIVDVVVGNTDTVGVVILLFDEEFLTRNGFVSVLPDVVGGGGTMRRGVGSSKGDTSAATQRR